MLNRADVTAAYLRSAPHRLTDAPANGGVPADPVRQARILRSTVPATSPAVSRTLGDLSLPDDVLVTGVRRGTSELIPRGSLVLRAGDVVSLPATPDGEAYARSIIFDEAQPRKGHAAQTSIARAQERLRALTAPMDDTHG
jgi:NhaP-type Na+/H+ and K+/H+ antiporter